MKCTMPVMLMVTLMLTAAAIAQESQMINTGEPFGSLKLVDEVDCGSADAAVIESSPGVSEVQDILGRPCRVLKTEGEPKYFAYILGKGKVQAGKAYLLTVDFPEDRPRSMYILNRGNETPRGVYTGASIGDTLFNYTSNNAESLDIPLSGQYRTWKTLFRLHDRYVGIKMFRNDDPRTVTPEEGFHVIIAQPDGKNIPLSAGAAVSRIRLFEVEDPKVYYAKVNFPPADLPRRYLFAREEMSDSVVGARKPEQRGLQDTDWYRYKAELHKVLGMNIFSKDLLEFGHNQGWDSDSSDPWYHQARQPGRWVRILNMLKEFDLDVLPYYEYAGGPGPGGMGIKKLARPLNTEGPYTHITWSERFYADVTDPDTLAEAKKLLDYTIVRHKDKADFVGAWFRVRPSHIPMSFHDNTLERFAQQANNGVAITREQIRADQELYQRYSNWWFDKRREFFVALRDHLRASGIDDALIFFTADNSESGPAITQGVVTDQPTMWEEIFSAEDHKDLKVVDINSVIRQDLYLNAVTKPRFTWAHWEWQHSLPQADPQNLKQTEGVLYTMSMGKAFTAASPKPFDLYRVPSGLALTYHYPLNEDVMGPDKKSSIVGYFVCDMERAGPYCMLSEAMAMANGDPRCFGYLFGASMQRGFPEYVRNFNTAFLALPALPSERLDGAASRPEVVVRKIDAKEHGIYLAVVNTGLTDAKDVTITLPAEGSVTNAATGEAMTATDGKVELEMYPCQLISLHIQP